MYFVRNFKQFPVTRLHNTYGHIQNSKYCFIFTSAVSFNTFA